MRAKSIKTPNRVKVVPDDLVTVAKYGNSMQAQLARTKLQSQRIRSYVLDENLISLMPVYDIALGGVRLAVRGRDLDRAARVLGLESRGNFWVPTKKFFFTYIFSEYAFGILIIPVGFLAYFISILVFGPLDRNLFLCFNALLFGFFSLAYSEKTADSILTWVPKRHDFSQDKAGIRKAILCLGLLALCLGIIPAYHVHFWFSAPIVFWFLFSLAAWKLFFSYISGAGFSAIMKRFIAWAKKKGWLESEKEEKRA